MIMRTDSVSSGASRGWHRWSAARPGRWWWRSLGARWWGYMRLSLAWWQSWSTLQWPWCRNFPLGGSALEVSKRKGFSRGQRWLTPCGWWCRGTCWCWGTRTHPPPRWWTLPANHRDNLVKTTRDSPLICELRLARIGMRIVETRIRKSHFWGWVDSSPHTRRSHAAKKE